jgi:eukaryotic-like serine/threonine-protein kinase
MNDFQGNDERPQTGLVQWIPPQKGEQIICILSGSAYTIGDLLGSGFYGDIYACEDVWGQPLVVKVLRPLVSIEDTRSKALSELHKLYQLRHPQITYMYEAFEFRNLCYLVLERCGMTLASLFDMTGFVGELWLEPVARCVLRAVHYIHLNGFVHQDIHLGNVLVAFARNELDPNAAAAINFKVADLGLAKLTGEIDVRADQLNESIRAPEAINPAEFGPADHRMDIYHCGLMFLQLIKSQRLVFSRQDILDGVPRQMALELKSPYNIGLEKALRRHVQFRTASADELWRDLKSPGGL